MGDYTDDEYRYFQITWRACDDSVDIGDKMIVSAEGTVSYTSDSCKTSTEIDNLIYNQGKVVCVRMLESAAHSGSGWLWLWRMLTRMVSGISCVM